ncbi:acyltransferase family protein [uncultured Catenibacterium sp.]|uniref:acyltransferase n=1 Tax=uncultured Catenibacterium sp. TaxID=286142 RepID=UPI0025CF5CE1|nr:acyltransferase family protein [uncultured Catenibacterium sp.]
MENKRNTGIELLKIVSMLMVVTLHVLLFGMNYYEAHILTPKGFITNMIEAICYCAVNIYAIITGYLMVNKNPKVYRIVDLWIQVVFYLIISTMLIKIYYPQDFTKRLLFGTFFPIITNQFWYFTAYFIMFWCIPLYNWIINHLTIEQFRRMIMTTLSIFCIIGWFASIYGEQVFGLNNGYSFLWITVLYFTGAGIKLYGKELFYIKKDISRNKVLLIGLLSGLSTFIAKILLVKMTTFLFGHEIYVDIFYLYVSPTVLIESICFVFYFSKLNIRSNTLISKISGATFGVYIIHLTPFFLNYCWKYLTPYKNTPLVSYLLIILVSVILLFTLCTVVEIIRIYVFDKLGFYKITKKIYDKYQKIIITFD